MCGDRFCWLKRLANASVRTLNVTEHLNVSSKFRINLETVRRSSVFAVKDAEHDTFVNRRMKE